MQQDERDDAQLMQAYAAGELPAFTALYDRYATRLWRFIYRLVQDRAVADELSQDVWLRLIRNPASYRPHCGAAGEPAARFATWLFTVARHCEIDHLRRLRSDPMHHRAGCGDNADSIPDPILTAPPNREPPARVQSRQQARQLLAALDALPAAQREAFLLQAEGGLSLAEIASVTGVGLETAKSRLRYARTALRRTLEELA